MDVSPVQSGSKCSSSDFSIERLLSDDTKNREESGQVPDWLCCTRYRPPRLPRAPVCRSRRAGRHARVPFTAAQASALEAAYSRAPYLAPPALRALAAALQLRDDRIKIWFQNRRARERREKSVNITPPHAITLPPTAPVSNTPSFQHSRLPHSADTRVNEHNDSNSLINKQRHVRISETIDARRHEVVLRQRLEGNARFMNAQDMSSLFPYKVESDEDDDGSLDIETIED